MAFQPTKPKPATEPAYLRVDVADLRRIAQIADQEGLTPPEVMRQAIHFALENMDKPHA